MAPPLEHHVELSDQKVDVVSLLGLEGLSDDSGGLLVLLTPKCLPIHFQNYVAHLELSTVMGRTSSLNCDDPGQRLACVGTALNGDAQCGCTFPHTDQGGRWLQQAGRFVGTLRGPLRPGLLLAILVLSGCCLSASA